jgi:PAS domain S-box-containing protein
MIEDLTEQRKREHDLRLASFTLEHGHEAIFWARPDGGLAEVNAGAARLLGYSREQLRSMSIWDFDENVSAQDWPKLWAELHQRGSLAMETSLRTRDGLSLPAEVNVAYEQFGGSEYSCGFVHDVSQRKQAEKDLRASEELYRSLFENAAATVLTMDLEENITAVNRTGEQVLGYPREELVGKNLAEILPPDQQNIARGMTARKLREGGTTTYELDVIAKDGRRLPMQITSNLILEDGNPVGAQGIAIDISEQRRAREALRRSEEHFRALVENAMDLTVVLGTDGKVLYTSPSLERVLGYKAENRLGKSTFDIIHPDDAASVRAAIARTRKTPGSSATLELRVRHQDGSWHFMEVVGRNLLDSPVVSGIVVNARDITERKRAEEWFHRHGNRLSGRPLASRQPGPVPVSRLLRGGVVEVALRGRDPAG